MKRLMEEQHLIGVKETGALEEIVVNDESLSDMDKDKRKKYVQMARIFDEALESLIYKSSIDLAKMYRTEGLGDSALWREFLKHPTVSVFLNDIRDEQQLLNASRALSTDELRNSDALKIVERIEEKNAQSGNSNIIVFFMDFVDYGDKKKLNNYGKYKDPKELVLRNHSDGSVTYRCPVCEVGETFVERPAFYGDCDVCGATLNDFIPLPHQQGVISSKETYKLILGGYGSGKTNVAMALLAAHALSIPKGRAIVVAQTLDQVRRAVFEEFGKFMPKKFIKRQTKVPIEIELTNGYQIFAYSSRDDEPIRSAEVDFFYMEEASKDEFHSIFNQSSARIRRPTGQIFNDKGEQIGDRYQVIMASNPEETWYMEHFILRAGNISASPSVDASIYEDLQIKNPEKNYHVFLSSSRDNHHLPRDYVANMAAGKSPEWIKKYIDCYLDVKEGRVYKDFMDAFVEDFYIPDDWVRVAGYDFGVLDPTAFIIGAVDPETDITYFYDEYKLSGGTIDEHGLHISEMLQYTNDDGLKVPYTLMFPVQADPAIKKRNERDLTSHEQYFYSRTGIKLDPADNRVATGIAKVNNLISLGKIKIFNSLVETKYEMMNYTYQQERSSGLFIEKVVDKDDHLMDALRYVCTRIPENGYKDIEVYGGGIYRRPRSGEVETSAPYKNENKVQIGRMNRGIDIAMPRNRR